MTIQLTAAGLRKIFPRSPQVYIDELVKGQHHLAKAGILKTRQRLAHCLANVEHECGGFTIKNLTENINYTAPRAAVIWRGRFPGGSADVQRRFGTGSGWQLLMFDSVYGNRMGNRPGTNDGSRYIGRGACQHTGRDGYAEMEKRTGIPLVANPELAGKPEHQAALIGAFWSWKNMNPKADAGNFTAVVKAWNGGTIGIAERRELMTGNDPSIRTMPDIEGVAVAIEQFPTKPVVKVNTGVAGTAVVEQLPTKPIVKVNTGVAGAVVAAGTGATVVAAKGGVDINTIFIIAFVALAMAIGGWFLFRNRQ